MAEGTRCAIGFKRSRCCVIRLCSGVMRKPVLPPACGSGPPSRRAEDHGRPSTTMPAGWFSRAPAGAPPPTSSGICSSCDCTMFADSWAKHDHEDQQDRHDVHERIDVERLLIVGSACTAGHLADLRHGAFFCGSSAMALGSPSPLSADSNALGTADPVPAAQLVHPRRSCSNSSPDPRQDDLRLVGNCCLIRRAHAVSSVAVGPACGLLPSAEPNRLTVRRRHRDRRTVCVSAARREACRRTQHDGRCA
jgi:hypothetical protein